MSTETVSLTVGVPRETYAGERRVALIPGSLAPLKKAGLTIVVETGAGIEAGFTDEEYSAAGGQIASRSDLFAMADIILQVRAAGANRVTGRPDLALFRPGQWLIGMCDPFTNLALMADLAARQVSSSGGPNARIRPDPESVIRRRKRADALRRWKTHCRRNPECVARKMTCYRSLLWI